MLCLDASYVVNILTNQLSARDLAEWQSWLVQRRPMIAPHHMRSEISNALHKARLRGEADDIFVERAVAALQAIPIQYVDDDLLINEALDIARDLGLLATYDAFYLALAARYRADLITSDRKLWEATHARFDWVHFVRELPLE